jgi:hypothetical protein
LNLSAACRDSSRGIAATDKESRSMKIALGAAIGGVGGALLFGVIAIRDAESLLSAPARRRER